MFILSQAKCLNVQIYKLKTDIYSRKYIDKLIGKSVLSYSVLHLSLLEKHLPTFVASDLKLWSVDVANTEAQSV